MNAKCNVKIKRVLVKTYGSFYIKQIGMENKFQSFQVHFMIRKIEIRDKKFRIILVSSKLEIGRS